MTGTADTEAYEFQQIYGLETTVIPTHQKMIREDRMDQVFRTTPEKHQAIINDIKDCYERSRFLSAPLRSRTRAALRDARKGEAAAQCVKREAARARGGDHRPVRPPQDDHHRHQHGGPRHRHRARRQPEPEVNKTLEDEALDAAPKKSKVEQIRFDWQKLHNQVVAAGGLHSRDGTARVAAHRQSIAGRSGRQAILALAVYLALEDPLLRIFASDRVAAIMQRLKMPEGEAIEHPWVTRSIENAQRKVEARNFDIRKHLLDTTTSRTTSAR